MKRMEIKTVDPMKFGLVCVNCGKMIFPGEKVIARTVPSEVLCKTCAKLDRKKIVVSEVRKKSNIGYLGRSYEL